MAACEKCGSDDLDLIETMADGRLLVACGACGHKYVRGTASRPSSTRAARRPAATAAPGGAAAVNDRAIAAVLEEIIRRGGQARVERRGAKKEIIARSPGSSRDVVILVRARTRGDWQTQASHGREREPEEVSTRFWLMVDLFADTTNFYVVPEWWIQNDIREKHEAYLAHHGGTRPATDKADHTKIETARVQEWLERWDQIFGPE